MHYEELIILLPCHSLEDFPTHHEGEDADSLLANWTALWHPRLLHQARRIPSWYRVDDPPATTANRLIVIPTVGYSELAEDFVRNARDAGAVVIRRETERDKIVSQALEPLGDTLDIDAEIVADFLALGYAYLQVELLTRQMRYSSNLDEVHFENQLIAAAESAISGDSEATRDQLQACFDTLAEERDHYYSVEAFLIDLTMIAGTTLGPALQGELSRELPVNLLITGEQLQEIPREYPATMEALETALTEDRVGLIGGEVSEERLPLFSAEQVLSEITKGQDAFEAVTHRPLTVYGRRRFGLTPLLPQILEKTGYQGAFHCTLDDGRFPEGSQFKVRWEGCDGTAIDAIARAPMDATKPETFLAFASKLGESMDMDHVATICIAHWPGQSSVWLDDLRRVARYGNALGRFVTIDDYFRDTDLPGHLDKYNADQYRSPYLKQAVIRREENPISSVITAWRANVVQTEAKHFAAMKALVAGTVAEPDSAEPDRAFAEVLPRESGEPEPGVLVCNPHSFPRRISVDLSSIDGYPNKDGPIYAVGEIEDKPHALVDVPAFGYAWVTAEQKSAPRERRAKPLAEANVLHNEFFEAVIHPETGALQGIHGYEARGNRLSQQLAYREPGKNSPDRWADPDSSAVYSKMVADDVTVKQASTLVGEIVSNGRLIHPNGETLATFRQTYRIQRGSRVLRVKVDLEPTTPPRADPWNSYYASRFAWATEVAQLSRGMNEVRQVADAKRLDAPMYIEVDDLQSKTTIITGGLPYHQRHGMRMLDTILQLKTETQNSFEFGIGVDLKYPLQDAISFLSSNYSVSESAAKPKPNLAWLLRVSSRNVNVTHCEPIIENDRLAGLRIRLLETMNRPAEPQLMCCRPFTSAQQVTFKGTPLGECRIEDGAAKLALAGSEWVEIEARF